MVNNPLERLLNRLTGNYSRQTSNASSVASELTASQDEEWNSDSGRFDPRNMFQIRRKCFLKASFPSISPKNVFSVFTSFSFYLTVLIVLRHLAQHTSKRDWYAHIVELSKNGFSVPRSMHMSISIIPCLNIVQFRLPVSAFFFQEFALMC